MVFTGLIERLSKKVNAAKFATKLAVAGGLATILGVPDSNAADSTPVFNYSIYATDANGNAINNGATVTSGLINVSLQLQTAQLAANTSITTAYAKPTISFSSGSINNISVGGYSGTPNTSFNGTPTSGDVFTGATNPTNNNTFDGSSTFTFNRTSDSSSSLNSNSTYYFGTVQLTPQAGTNGTFVFTLPGYSQNTSTSSFFLENANYQSFPNTSFGSTAATSFTLHYNIPTAVPEPSTYALLATGALAVLFTLGIAGDRKSKTGNSSMVANNTYVVDFAPQNGQYSSRARTVGLDDPDVIDLRSETRDGKTILYHDVMDGRDNSPYKNNKQLALTA